MEPNDLKQKAFELFDNMKPGEIIIVSKIAKKDPEAFRQYGKDYIDQGGQIEFNSDYRKIKKLALWITQRLND